MPIPRIFLLSLFIPTQYFIGSARLSVYRIVILLSIPYLFSRYLKLKKGLPDYCIVIFVAWSWVSLSYLHGFLTAVEPSAIFLIETMGAYIIGRIAGSNIAEYGKIIRTFLFVIFAMFPFAVFEATTGKNVYMELFSNFGHTYIDVFKPERLGLDRVQAGFEHPILFGVVCFSLMSSVYFYYLNSNGDFRAAFFTLVVLMVGFLSLSSGPIVAAAVQIIILSYERLFSNFDKRYQTIALIVIPIIVLLEILSDRSLYQISLQLLAFNTNTAYNRVLIFSFGVQSFFEYPIFGIGWNEWDRPAWMSASMDMFWLLWFVKHGFISGASILLCTVYLIWKIITNKTANRAQYSVHVGLGISIIGYFSAGWTVHFWNSSYVLFIFMIGLAASVLSHRDECQLDRPEEVEKKIGDRVILQ